jgi:DedD protein
MEPQLKQRLIGAVVLVSIAVLIIPAFLEEETPQVPRVVQRDMAPMPVYEFPDAPAEPAPEVMEEVTEGLTTNPAEMAGLPPPEPGLPLPEPAPEVGMPEDGTTVSTDTGQPVPPTQIATPVPTAEPLPPPARPTNGDAARTPGNGGWVIQLGSFSSMENADSLRARLIVGGFQAFVSPLQVDGKQSFRVRVSGGKDRVAAEAMRSRLREELGYSGMILRGD